MGHDGEVSNVGDQTQKAVPADLNWQENGVAAVAELRRREQVALAMGGEKKLARLRAEGRLNARERVAYLLDEGSFFETGRLAQAPNPDMADRSAADGKVVGLGQVDGRDIGVVSNDFTVLGASSSDVNSRKIKHLTKAAMERGFPLVFLGESSGGRLPDAIGARAFSPTKGDPNKYRRTRESPWAAAVLGPSYGSSAWYAARSDFCVMRRGAVMAVASPRLISAAVSQEVDPEELGGWRVHAQTTGMADAIVDSDEEALDAIRRFLSYMPSNAQQLPPRVPVPEDADSEDRSSRLLDLLPSSRRAAYDMRKLIDLVVDTDSRFDIKGEFARNLITCLARVDGSTVGIIANNPRYLGGAVDVNACRKATSFIVLCDSFNIPLIFLVDQPGLLIGKDGEREGAIGKVMNWVNALSLVTVPFFSIMIRKNYGQSRDNMGFNAWASETAAWPTAELSFMDPIFAAMVIHGIKREDDPERFDRSVEEFSRGTSAFDSAAAYGAKNVIDPRDTRAYLKRVLSIHFDRMSGGIGQHLLHTWPTSY